MTKGRLDFPGLDAGEMIQAPDPDYPEGMDSSNDFWAMHYKEKHPPCRALVASDGEHGIVLDYIGPDFDYMVHVDTGAFHHDEWEGTKAGVWIWEGRLQSSTDYFGEHDEWLEGRFRALTADEWDLHRLNDSPWDPADWGTPWPKAPEEVTGE